MYFTVFTPTYNRGGVLKRLYKSLKKQTFQDFEWIVIDDGSTDDTSKLMESILQEDKNLKIVYEKKENGGKHTAINMGAELAHGEFFFIVDCDDYLPDNSLEIIHRYTEQIRSDFRYAGVAGLRGNSEKNAWNHFGIGGKETTNNEYLKKEYLDATSFEYRYKFKIYGDRAEVVRTEVLKEHPFPVYKEEKFVTEGVLWSTLAHENYLFRWFNQVVYITEEYRTDGLTKNIKDVHKKSPRGMRDYDNFLIGCCELPWLERLRAGVNYFISGSQANDSNIVLFRNIACKWIAIPCFIMSRIRR